MILAFSAEDGDAVVGRLDRGGIEISMCYVAGPRDLDAFRTELVAGESIFFGRFPGRENSINAVTFDLPDRTASFDSILIKTTSAFSHVRLAQDKATQWRTRSS